MGGINRRLKALEGMAGPNPCPVCSGWLAVHISGELDTLTRDGIEADAHQRREYLQRTREQRLNGGTCPACGEEPLEVRIPGMSEMA